MTAREFPALGFDPAPGDPTALDSAAGRTTTAAGAFATAAGRLTPAVWTGDAGDACRTTIGPLPSDLTRASDAHRITARTLADYAVGLRSRQIRAAELESEAATLRAREATAVTEVNRLAATRAPAGTGELAELSTRYATARSRAESAGADLAQVLAAAKLLADDHDAAAAAAARTIRAAADTAPHERPGLLSRALDRAKRWITDHADVLTTISTVLKGISAVLGVVALVPGLQFLAPLAMAAGGIALGIDATIKLATGRGSWRSLALDAALTVMPWGRVYRTLKQIPEADLALAAANRAIPANLKGTLFRLGRNLPEGVTREQAARARRLIHVHAAHYGDDVVVHGSRASYRVHYKSDIDIGIRVSPAEFARIHHERFVGKVETADEKTAMVNSMTKGIVHFKRAGMKLLHDDLVDVFGGKVDISVIRRGGEFDTEPWIRL